MVQGIFVEQWRLVRIHSRTDQRLSTEGTGKRSFMGSIATVSHASCVVSPPLRIIADDRGAVLHMLRADSPFFTGFGEVYFSETRSGTVKPWKRHRRMTQRLAVPVGRMLFAILDN